MGSLILSSSGLNQDKQLTDPLLHFTLNLYGKVLINKCCSLGVVCVKLLGRILTRAFKLKSFAKEEMVNFLHGPSN